MTTLAKVVDIEPLALSPKETGRLLGVSRDHVYRLVNTKELKSSTSGNRILVDYQSVREYYDRITEEAGP